MRLGEASNLPPEVPECQQRSHHGFAPAWACASHARGRKWIGAWSLGARRTRRRAAMAHHDARCSGRRGACRHCSALL